MAEFEIKNNVLVKYNGRTKEVKIPDGVEKIDGSVFSSRKSIKTVIIPASVTEIGCGAFEECLALEQVNFSEGLELIDWSAFSGCKSLKTITIPASVKEIGARAFENCTSLEQVILSKEVKIDPSAFEGCTGLKHEGDFIFVNTLLVAYTGNAPKVVVPEKTKVIGDCAFKGKEVNQVVLPEGLEVIGVEAFADCKSLKSITIPASVKKVGLCAFSHSMKEITVEGWIRYGHASCTDAEVIYAAKASVADFFSGEEEAYLIGFARLLQKGIAMDRVIIEKNNKYIKQHAKKLCDTNNEELFAFMLKNALIPLKDVDELIAKFSAEKNVAHVAALIDYKEKNFTEKQKERQFNKQFEIREPTIAELKQEWTFAKTEDGTYRISFYKGKDIDVIVPSMIKGVKVTEIGNGKTNFFNNSGQCKTVKSVTLPDGIVNIAQNAFQSCESLERIVLPEGLETIGVEAFSNCRSLKTIMIPTSVKRIGDGAFDNGASLEQVTLAEGLEKIGAKAFEHCKALKTITIPSSAKEICDMAFCDCDSLEQVALSEGLEKIGKGAFAECISLKKIAIPSSVKEIGGTGPWGYGAFIGCESLEEVVLSEGLEKLGWETFSGCKSLISITIPASIKEICYATFYACDSLEQIILSEGLEKIGKSAFENCKSLKKISIPASVKEIGGDGPWARRHGVFISCESLEEVVLSEGLEKIGRETFSGCKSLISITIPASVKEIRWNAFSGCESLEQVKLLEGLEQIGRWAFSGCVSLKKIIIPTSVKTIGENVFYECSDLTIYCRSEEKPISWNEYWDSLDIGGKKAKVVWGYKGE